MTKEVMVMMDDELTEFDVEVVDLLEGTSKFISRHTSLEAAWTEAEALADELSAWFDEEGTMMDYQEKLEGI